MKLAMTRGAMRKMSKSSQTEKSLSELSPETVQRAAESETRYNATRESLRQKYGTTAKETAK